MVFLFAVGDAGEEVTEIVGENLLRRRHARPAAQGLHLGPDGRTIHGFSAPGQEHRAGLEMGAGGVPAIFFHRGGAFFLSPQVGGKGG